MKRIFVVVLMTLCLFTASAGNNVKSLQIYGHVGDRIDACIDHRILGEDVDEFVQVFAKQDEVYNRWGTEFWGKWVQGAIAAYQYKPNDKLYKLIENSVQRMISYQLPNGYLGNYDEKHQLQGWDIWGRKYTILGMVKWYKLTGDKQALDCASRLLDYTLTQLGPDKKSICQFGLFKGMAACSILEPVVMLYNETHQDRYLEFAKWIVAEIEGPTGAHLISLADVPVNKRFPVNGKDWWSISNGRKAYEMMSCYVGILELAKVLNRKDYVDAVEKVVKNIREDEINVAGSGAANECWYLGKLRQTMTAFNMMETCVSFTWMQINERLWQMTGKAVYAENIEQTFYNAILASMKIDASAISKYTPLEGQRVPGENQCGTHTHCCSANGPRAFATIPRFMYGVRENQLDVNFYAPSLAHVTVKGLDVQLQQFTTYPVDGKVTFRIDPAKTVQFALALRIPEWSKQGSVKVNGQNVDFKAGDYCVIDRTWTKNDVVELELDMRTRATEMNHMVALQRGPIALARDTRFNDGFIDEYCFITPDKEGFVKVTPIQAPEGMWMAFQLEAIIGGHRDGAKVQPFHVCDFASAGNTWTENQRYRVWIPKQYFAMDEN